MNAKEIGYVLAAAAVCVAVGACVSGFLMLVVQGWAP